MYEFKTMNANKNIFRKRLYFLFTILFVYGALFLILSYWPLETKKEVSSLIMPVVEEYNSPIIMPTGVAFDGEFLWISSSRTNIIIAVNPDTGEVVKNFTNPISSPWGLAWDGSFLWVDDSHTLRLYQINVTSGSIVTSIKAPGINPSGLTWDGENLWVSDFATERIYQVNPSDGSILGSFDTPTPGRIPSGLAWDGDTLWVADVSISYVMEIQPSNGQVVSYYYSTGYFPGDLAWEGNYLWLLDYSQHMIYRTLPGVQEIKTIRPSVPSWFFTFVVISIIPILLSLISAGKQENTILSNEEKNESYSIPSNKKGIIPLSALILAVIGSLYSSYELFRIIYNVVMLKKTVLLGNQSTMLYRFEMLLSLYTACYWIYSALVQIWSIFSNALYDLHEGESL